MRILIDMDGVLVDIERGFIERGRALLPEIDDLMPDDRQDFSLVGHLPEPEQAKLRELIKQEGFFASLPPVEGALEAITQMRDELGWELYIVTSAGIDKPHAASEKYRWVDQHLGPDFLRNLIITPAKYMVKGDILIDDRPILRGEDQAEWEHVLYDWPYNRDVTTKRRLTWDNWREVLVT